MNKQVLLISISTFIAVISWIAFDIQHARPSVPVNPKITAVLEPLEPNFNEKTLALVAEVNPAPDLVDPFAAARNPIASGSATFSPIPDTDPAITNPEVVISSPSPSVSPSPSPVTSPSPSPVLSPIPSLSPSPTPLPSPLPSS